MRERSLLFAVYLGLTVFLPTGNIYAQGGFTGPSAPPYVKTERHSVTVARAKKLRDDSRVIMQGNIIRFIGSERYVFADNTGEITVEIDHEVWHGLSVDENDKVEIYGEIDRDDRRIEVDVKFIRRLDS